MEASWKTIPLGPQMNASQEKTIALGVKMEASWKAIPLGTQMYAYLKNNTARSTDGGLLGKQYC